MRDNRKGFALIGFGYWGKNIFRNLYEMGCLSTACDTNQKLLGEFKAKYPEVNFTDSIDSVLRDVSITAVLLATPAITHYDIVKRALLAGKDVFVEKPLALTLKEGSELVEIARKNSRILMVGHILQYHPAVRVLKEMISRGDLGQIRYIYSNRLNIGKLRVEENILWSFAPHDISVMLMLIGEEPVRIAASGGSYLTTGVDDVTLTSLEFKSGVKGHVYVSWLHPFKEQKLVVVGSKAMVVFDDVSKEKLFLYPHLIEWREGRIPVAQKAEHSAIPFPAGEPLRLELEHFVECVATRSTPRTDGAEGLRVLNILENCEKAISGKKSIELSAGGGSAKDYFSHESAYIDENVEIGEGTSIWHFSHVLGGTTIGKKCKIGQNVVIGPKAKIGNGVKIQNNVSVYEGVTLEDEVFCGPSCVFTNVFNPRSAIIRMHELKATLVKKGASIGANATIVCGHTVGRHAFIGAGAVVTKDVPDYALVYGNPGEIKGWMCECGVKLDFKGTKAVCSACAKEYSKQESIVERTK